MWFSVLFLFMCSKHHPYKIPVIHSYFVPLFLLTIPLFAFTCSKQGQSFNLKFYRTIKGIMPYVKKMVHESFMNILYLLLSYY
jgi:hypothetical protein